MRSSEKHDTTIRKEIIFKWNEKGINNWMYNDMKGH